MEGIIKAVCISAKTRNCEEKYQRSQCDQRLWIRGDAHAGKWHRQVSFLSADIVDEFNEKVLP